MKKELDAKRWEAAESLAYHITDFFNVAFGRRTAASRQFIEAIYGALTDRYTANEIRIAFWAARCLTGKAAWLSDRLRADLLPHIVLRHSGRINNITGKESVRWLDELLARLPEISTPMVTALLKSLPEHMQQSERELLNHMGVSIGE